MKVLALVFLAASAYAYVLPEVEESEEWPADFEPILAGVPNTRGFKDIFGKVTGILGNVPILGEQVNNIKQLVEVVKANKGNPKAIADAVIQLGLAPTINTLCSLPIPVPGKAEACSIAGPALGVLSTFG